MPLSFDLNQLVDASSATIFLLEITLLLSTDDGKKEDVKLMRQRKPLNLQKNRVEEFCKKKKKKKNR
jgi:hypothetical protein